MSSASSYSLLMPFHSSSLLLFFSSSLLLFFSSSLLLFSSYALILLFSSSLLLFFTSYSPSVSFVTASTCPSTPHNLSHFCLHGLAFDSLFNKLQSRPREISGAVLGGQESLDKYFVTGNGLEVRVCVCVEVWKWCREWGFWMIQDSEGKRDGRREGKQFILSTHKPFLNCVYNT